MQNRTPRAFVAAAALALFTSACTDTPTTAPAARAPGERASLSASGSGPTLIPNSVKYRDEGGKPAKGRSGNAEMSTRAVVDRAGVAEVEYSVRHATEWWHEGTLSRMQVKALAPDGQPKFTRNLDDTDLSPWGYPTSSGELQLRGVAGGDQLQLQANVTGLDAHRMDVVTVKETVKRLPDLSVRMTAPRQVEANTRVNVVAVVTERNGDLGSPATCELYAGGDRVDYALGVWVDAGDAVTCVMTVTLRAPGTHLLEVRVAPWGRDWDASNNTDTTTIQVHGESPRFYTTASFEEAASADSTVSYSAWQNTLDRSGGEHRDEQFETRRHQTAVLSAYMPARTTGPVDAQVSMSTGGRVVDSAQWSSAAPTEGNDYWCTNHWNGPAAFWMCTYGGSATASTQVTYGFMAGAVTYHSLEYQRAWDDLAGTEWVYHWNYGYAFDETVPLGDDWTFNVRLNTSQGEHDLSRTLPLTRSGPFGFGYPYQCSSWEDLEWGYSSTYCFGSSRYETYVTGYAAD